jgi:hypothetical protein
MNNRNIRTRPPWPEDFDVALNAQQKAMENRPPARIFWRPRLLILVKLLAIVGLLLVWFTLMFPNGRF